MSTGIGSTSSVPPNVVAGREALGRREWPEALALFESAVAEGPMPEALEGLSQAAYVLGEGGRSLEARERAFALYLKAGRPAEAARTATWLGLAYISGHGADAVSNGWLQRARRLLEDLPPGPEHAWLTFWEGHLALLFQGDAETARRKASEARELGRRLGLADVDTMGDGARGAAARGRGTHRGGDAPPGRDHHRGPGGRDRRRRRRRAGLLLHAHRLRAGVGLRARPAMVRSGRRSHAAVARQGQPELLPAALRGRISCGGATIPGPRPRSWP